MFCKREQANFGALARALQRVAAAQPADVARPMLAQLTQLLRKESQVPDAVSAARSGV